MASPTAGIGPNDTLLIFLPDRTAPDAAWIARIEAAYPGLTVRFVSQADPVTGTVRDVNQLPAEVWEGVTLLVSHWPPKTVETKVISYGVETTLRATTTLPDLRFVQVPSAGADRWIGHETFKRPGVTIATGNGTHACVPSRSPDIKIDHR